MCKEGKQVLKQKKKPEMKIFVEPRLIRRGSLKDVIFASSLGVGDDSGFPSPTPR